MNILFAVTNLFLSAIMLRKEESGTTDILSFVETSDTSLYILSRMPIAFDRATFVFSMHNSIEYWDILCARSTAKS